jgi:predicted short-subunit dehydrogenase-like oxidoreductase (DUF2520 family)
LKISIIGSGNVATHIGTALKKAGHTIADVTGRNAATTNELADNLQAKANFDVSAIDSSSEVILLCVKDDAIIKVASLLPFSEKVIAHTSGFRSFNILEKAGNNIGIFYPLQSMKKEVALDFKTVPMLVEGNNNFTSAILNQLANDISISVHQVNELQRQYIHIAAVFANNFTNHLWELAEHILQEQNLTLDILRPLIANSAENIATHSPLQLQTGPAARKDFFTIDAHLNLLHNEEEMTKVYKVLTESILKHQA